MKAAFLTGIRELEIREAPDPTIEAANGVLLRIDTVGICGSDVHYYNEGNIGSLVVEYPFLVGHECGATVAQVGGDVTAVKVGDRVAVDPLIACGHCDQCLAGRRHTCRNQKFLACPGQAPGAMAELADITRKKRRRIGFPIGPDQAERIAFDFLGFTRPK